MIGSGFGGTMTALSLARAFKARGDGERILMLERGTWWTTQAATVEDKDVKTFSFLEGKGEPVQPWPAADNFRGFLDIYTRCVRRKGNEDGLYDLTAFGRKGLFGLRHNDGVAILRTSGVGGGSLIYANVTIRPPDAVAEDPRWPMSWSAQERDGYYDLARDAIGLGVGYALYQRDPAAGGATPPKPVNTGLSNIATYSPRLDPRWRQKPDPLNARRGLKQLDPAHSTPADDDNALWIDRARVFQAQMSGITDEFGLVGLVDRRHQPRARAVRSTAGAPRNYCERRGRCIVGCLPTARHTLDKQLMRAVHGTPKGDSPVFPDLHLSTLCQVDVIEALPGGGDPADYAQRRAGDRLAQREAHGHGRARDRRGRHRRHHRDHAPLPRAGMLSAPQRPRRPRLLDQRRLPGVPRQHPRAHQPHPRADHDELVRADSPATPSASTRSRTTASRACSPRSRSRRAAAAVALQGRSRRCSCCSRSAATSSAAVGVARAAAQPRRAAGRAPPRRTSGRRG